MTIGSYFTRACTYISDVSSAAVQKVSSLSRDDVAAAANTVKETAVKAKDATANVIRSTTQHCGDAFQLLILNKPLQKDPLPEVEEKETSTADEPEGDTPQQITLGFAATQNGATPAPVVRLPSLPDSSPVHSLDDLLGPPNPSMSRERAQQLLKIHQEKPRAPRIRPKSPVVGETWHVEFVQKDELEDPVRRRSSLKAGASDQPKEKRRVKFAQGDNP